jgi:hypothetical protein
MAKTAITVVPNRAEIGIAFAKIPIQRFVQALPLLCVAKVPRAWISIITIDRGACYAVRVLTHITNRAWVAIVARQTIGGDMCTTSFFRT